MAPVLLSEFNLPVNVQRFHREFWHDGKWFEQFLSQQLKDLSVQVGEWSPASETADHQQQQDTTSCAGSAATGNSWQRTVRSYHPSKISFPGLPSHAESWKVQVMELKYNETTTNENSESSANSENGQSLESLSIKEVNSFRGIPYADYFTVNTEWSIAAAGTSGIDVHTITVRIHLDFTFHKYTWLQGTIESNTKAELIEVYDLYVQAANVYLLQTMDTAAKASGATAASMQAHQRTAIGGPITSASLDDAVENAADDVESDVEEQDTTSRIIDPLSPVRGAAQIPEEELERRFSEDEDLLFYDCEEIKDDVLPLHPSAHPHGGDRAVRRMQRNKSNSSIIYGDADVESKKRISYDSDGRHKVRNAQRYGFYRSRETRRPSTPPELHQMYGYPNSSMDSHDLLSSDGEGKYASHHRNGRSMSRNVGDTYSARDAAVNIVETGFVLAEFLYWSVHHMYAFDLKELFNIHPAKVLARIRNSFLPGWHSPILIHPDIYGPLLAVFLLPQSLLISMETTRHGCNPTAQLGNAVVVSLYVWIGLSCLYRLLALLIAPAIHLKQCLSITGYSFFAWNAALLLMYPLELYRDEHQLPGFLPLVLFGVPSSLALGAMFWEHTAASSMTLQPASLPTSVQQCASQHSRCLQQLIWALPKIIAFIVVAGTHYQFLWYMARVFLPGRRQICQLKALVQPSQYADILTQKELRKFALVLLKGKKHGH